MKSLIIDTSQYVKQIQFAFVFNQQIKTFSNIYTKYDDGIYFFQPNFVRVLECLWIESLKALKKVSVVDSVEEKPIFFKQCRFDFLILQKDF